MLSLTPLGGPALGAAAMKPGSGYSASSALVPAIARCRLPLETRRLHVTILYDEPRVLLVPRDHRLAGKEFGHSRRHRRPAHAEARRLDAERLLAG
jgi:hypothetical protein